MGENSKIEWTDHTFNPWIGCTKVAAGCTNCYAESFAKRYGKAVWGPGGTRVRTSNEYWRQPLKWNREAAAAGERRRVFCASLADVFEDWDGPILASGRQPVYLSKENRASRGPADRATLDDVRRDLFELIDATPQLDWLLVTKRPENIRGMWPAVTIHTEEQAADRNERGGLYRRNVWVLASANDQETFNRNVSHLAAFDGYCAQLGLSLEPLTGPIDFGHRLWHDSDYPASRFIDWIIVGGESGHHARPFNIEWARSIRDQCAAAGVPCFVKQLGSQASDGKWGREDQERPPAFHKLLHPKGGDWNEWPADLRVRQFPQPAMADTD